MKIFKCLVAAAMLLTSTTAFAQFDTDNYTRVQASFVASGLSNSDWGGMPSIEPKGFSLGLIQGYSLTDDMPLFLEFGATLSWMHSAADIKAVGALVGDRKYTNMNIAIPVNAVYKYAINDKVAISGHAGLNLKVNMFAIEKGSYDVAGYGSDYKVNYLKKDDMGGRDKRGNIFQLGGQIGVGVHLSDFYVGWQFQNDFMNLVKIDDEKCRLHSNYITLGYQGEIFVW